MVKHGYIYLKNIWVKIFNVKPENKNTNNEFKYVLVYKSSMLFL